MTSDADRPILPGDFVEKAITGRKAGFSKICLKCYECFNERDCPHCTGKNADLVATTARCTEEGHWEEGRASLCLECARGFAARLEEKLHPLYALRLVDGVLKPVLADEAFPEDSQEEKKDV